MTNSHGTYLLNKPKVWTHELYRMKRKQTVRRSFCSKTRAKRKSVRWIRLRVRVSERSEDWKQEGGRATNNQGEESLRLSWVSGAVIESNKTLLLWGRPGRLLLLPAARLIFFILLTLLLCSSPTLNLPRERAASALWFGEKHVNASRFHLTMQTNKGNSCTPHCRFLLLVACEGITRASWQLLHAAQKISPSRMYLPIFSCFWLQCWSDLRKRIELWGGYLLAVAGGGFGGDRKTSRWAESLIQTPLSVPTAADLWAQIGRENCVFFVSCVFVSFFFFPLTLFLSLNTSNTVPRGGVNTT